MCSKPGGMDKLKGKGNLDDKSRIGTTETWRGRLGNSRCGRRSGGLALQAIQVENGDQTVVDLDQACAP